MDLDVYFSSFLAPVKDFDLAVFYWVNGFAGRWPWLDAVGIFFAHWAVWLLVASLAVFLAVDFKKYWRMVAEGLLAALIVRFVLVEFFYWTMFRARPFVHYHVTQLLAYPGSQTSFPSGHASFCFALSGIIYAYNRHIGRWFFAASFLIAISRVFVGVHWPLDIIFGALFGMAMAWVLNRLFGRYAWPKIRA